MPRRLCIAVLVLVLGAGCALRAEEGENTRERMILTVKPAVVMVYVPIKVKVTIQTEQGPQSFDPVDMSGAGSGFIVHPDGYIVTNGHVVKEYYNKENASLKQQAILQVLQQYVFPKMEQQNGRPLTREEMIGTFQQIAPACQCQVLKQLFVFLSNWTQFPAEIKQYSPPITPIVGKSEGIISFNEEESGKDIAILKIEQSNLPTVDLGDSSRVTLQEAVFPAGYPGVVTQHANLNQSSMLEASITSGHVSSLKLDVKGTPVIQFDAPVTWGNSGGSVFNSRGEAIGIATFISLKQTGDQSIMPIQGFNFAVPINTAKEFIAAAGVQPKSGLFATLWSQVLDLYFDRDYEDVIPKCDELLRLMPNQPDAKRIQVRSQEEMVKNPPGPKLLTIGLIAGGVLLVGVVIIIAVLASRSKPAPPAAGRTAGPHPPAADLKATVVDPGRMAGGAARIICEKGPFVGKFWEVPAAGLSLGRDPVQCSVVVPDDHVSKVHCVITATAAGLVVEDRNSTNGTFINQVGPKGIQRVEVRGGDRIILGSKQAAIFRVE